jgi:SAM-dependent methyltransferase
MSGFSSEWLTLREPYDLAARNTTVLDAMLAAFEGQASISVVDLACGTGSTLRAIGKRLPKRQTWRLVDNDLGLLGSAATLGHPPDVAVAARAIDLVRDLELALDGPIDLITTSALLDLVSEDWLERLLIEAAARRLPLYAALSYDGRVSFDPVGRFDMDIVAAVNRHQRGDKGFGPALGPDAARSAAVIAKRAGYSFVEGSSDWTFGAADHAIQREVLRGFADAAGELGSLPADRIADWLARRLELAAAGTSGMRVGHVDFFAMPMPIR